MTEGKPPRWKVLRLRGLRQRWIVNTVMPVLVLLILLMTLFSAGGGYFKLLFVEA